MLVGLLSRWCFLIGGCGRRQWAGRTVGFGGLRKNQVQVRASRREARLLLVVRSRRIGHFFVGDNLMGWRHRHAHVWRTRSRLCDLGTFWMEEISGVRIIDMFIAVYL
ncbi:hypothetical protein TNCV_4551181 [Trichonephila clavipes]|uniref:Secreted protein n=1 Tax=Trichonephila clavipes TaxID=2585209 RepID=A0A8X6S0Y6_TRICX|nr:hypothetical protein TNCV_4551181 [Trichonephila clavipes]